MTVTSDLADYLPFKQAFLQDPDRPAPSGAPLRASITTEGRAGIRKIRIRGHEIISDSGYAGGGSDFGPIPGELAVAALGGCLSHGWVLQAALAGVTLRSLRVDVETVEAPEGSGAPVGLEYTVVVDSDASPEELERLRGIVEEKSWVRRLLGNPAAISGRVSDLPAEIALEVEA